MDRRVHVIEKTSLELPKKKRVAAYARVSLGNEHMLHSLAAQVSYYSSLIQNNPEWEFAGIFADNNKTGTQESRPEFQRLLTECRNGNIDMVIVKSVSRMARNTVTLLNTVRELKDLKIDIFFEEQNIHTLSETGEMMLSLFAVFAQEESKNVSDNLKWRKRNDMKRGKTIPKKVYGYDLIDGRLVIIPEHAAVVREIFRLYLEGNGYTNIARTLNEKGVPTPGGTVLWKCHAVRSILTNEKMMGNILYQKNYVEDYLTKKIRKNRGELPMYLHIGTHEGIVSEEIFKKAQAERERRSNDGGLYHYEGVAFRKKILCPCGMNFMHTINGTGNRTFYVWRCNGHDKRNGAVCTSKDIRQDVLMQAAAEVLGLEEFDSDVFNECVKEIYVPENYKLLFRLKDGTEILKTWEPKKRGPKREYDGKRW